MADVEFHVGSGDKQLQRHEPELVDIDDVLRDVVVVLGVGRVRDTKRGRTGTSACCSCACCTSWERSFSYRPE